MIVVFQSESENKSIGRVERVLDSYANRIGRRSWMTAITQEGLNAVHLELRKIATKDTSVSCLLVKNRMQTELLWIVGRRDRFNSFGNVPVNETGKENTFFPNEESWENLPIISALTAFAALWHDLGKASEWFQDKLKKNKVSGDPLRHEWMSCMLLYSFILSTGAKTDEEWLNSLVAGNLNEKMILQELKNLSDEKSRERFFSMTKQFPVFHFVSWLILSHHRMPLSVSEKEEYEKLLARKILGMPSFLMFLSPKQGYITDSFGDIDSVFSFPKGLSIISDQKWKKENSKWAARIIPQISRIEEYEKNNSFYEVLMLSRCALVLADHKQSSLDGNAASWDELVANLDSKGKPKQSLIEHVLGVQSLALKVAHYLPYIQDELPRAYDIRAFRIKSSQKYFWQEKAVNEIKKVKQENDLSKIGCFVVNMASTGCGKTIANAKILHALSKDESLRCSVLLGLRTLTIQTGTEYQERIGISKDDLGVIIGSKAFIELSNSANDESLMVDEDSSSFNGFGLDGVETSFLPEDIRIRDIISDESALKMLYPPVLVCTIDQVIQASEITMGARGLIPLLRVLSSDIIIDEIDDYSGDDLIAVGRLVYLCGALGRKIVVSSATIPPEMIEGLSAAYQRGWTEYSRHHGCKNKVLLMFSDEFSSRSEVFDSSLDITNENDFREKCVKLEKQFIEKRIRNLGKRGTSKRGEIVPIYQKTEDSMFEAVIERIGIMHSRHFDVDPYTGKKASFGLIRFSNIKQCIKFSRFLDSYEFGDELDVRFITYHAREVLLIRHSQEEYLDKVLCRKDSKKIFDDRIIRSHIDGSKKNNITFIVISSPVEELGRDHDFDWAIIEPASYRSIIQTSGRVLRHRDKQNNIPNVAVLQYNVRGLYQRDDHVCFKNPGFETCPEYLLPSHDLFELISEKELQNGITSIPRIRITNNDGKPMDFASLEHKHVDDLLGCGQERVAGLFSSYYSTPVMLSALSQKQHPFRKQSCNKNELFYVEIDGRMAFIEKRGEKEEVVTRLNGISIKNEVKSSREWIYLVYNECVERYSSILGLDPSVIERKYGEICFPCYENQGWIYSDKYGLEEK